MEEWEYRWKVHGIVIVRWCIVVHNERLAAVGGRWTDLLQSDSDILLFIGYVYFHDSYTSMILSGYYCWIYGYYGG